MNAYGDFIATLKSIGSIADKLGAVPVGIDASRGENHLILNGLRVSAFAAFEDFVRRRAHEVISWLGEAQVRFEQFPEALQMLVLQGTIEGVSFSLSRTEKNDRVIFLQIQGLLLGNSGENSKFVPSEFFFGRSASNLSRDDLRSLLAALGLGDKLLCLSDVAALVGMQHLGSINETFSRLSKSRHGAAHAFPSNYKLAEFKTDISSALPLLAFAFDTSLSQGVHAMKKTIIDDQQKYQGFDVKRIGVRIIEFDTSESCWKEYRNGRLTVSLTKGKLAKRVKELETGQVGKDDTILLKSDSGGISGWIQPLR